MISDDEREDTWTFLDPQGRSVRVRVTLMDYPDQPGRSAFIDGVVNDGRLVMFENGRFLCDDGTELLLPLQ